MRLFGITVCSSAHTKINNRDPFLAILNSSFVFIINMGLSEENLDAEVRKGWLFTLIAASLRSGEEK